MIRSKYICFMRNNSGSASDILDKSATTSQQIELIRKSINVSLCSLKQHWHAGSHARVFHLGAGTLLGGGFTGNQKFGCQSPHSEMHPRFYKPQLEAA